MITDYHTLTGYCIEYPEVLVNVVNTCTEHLDWPTLTGQCDINDVFHTSANWYILVNVETKQISTLSTFHSTLFLRLRMKDQTLSYEKY